MPKTKATVRITLKQFLDACTDQELRRLAQMIKRQPYRARINEQLCMFPTPSKSNKK